MPVNFAVVFPFVQVIVFFLDAAIGLVKGVGDAEGLALGDVVGEGDGTALAFASASCARAAATKSSASFNISRWSCIGEAYPIPP